MELIKQACDNACPSLDTHEAVQAQNWGCLPDPYAIRKMLENNRVWMCHSNPQRPCIATGLDAVPDGFEAVTEY